MLGWLATATAMTPLREVLGPKAAKKVGDSIGATSVGELLSRLPQRYAAQGHSLNVDYAQVGESITAVVEVVSVVESAPGATRRPLRVTVTDGRRIMPMPLFGQGWLVHVLHPGTRLLVLGTLDEYRGNPQIKGADLLVIGADGQPGAATGKLKKLIDGADGMAELRGLLARPYLPIHRGRKGLSGILLALYIRRVLRWLPRQDEPLPEWPSHLPTFDVALREAHFPGAAGPQAAIDRLKYDEALELQLALALRRAGNADRVAPECPPSADGRAARLAGNLPFELTGGQRSVLADISADLSRPTPMNRLLQGEVGSGKTVVALLGMLQVLDEGRQSVLLAPTEVLAAQHARTIAGLLDDAGVDAKVTSLTGSMPVGEKRAALLDIVSGESGIIVGTHALLSEGVDFFDLGMVVIDEQHRFGVRQRDRLRERGRDGMTPHVLVMTATPIPRTLAMTVFGDLDVSELAELPGRRRNVRTIVVPTVEKPKWEARAWEVIREEAEAGHRAFVVSPRILGEGESVEDNFDLARRNLPGVAVGFLHGRMSAEEKSSAMADFAAGRTSVLVATTVVEVGVDVPEATVMMIRRAESYGVSQLHQLRGRIGRGELPGRCFLCTETMPDTPERARLDAIAATNDGFRLAEIDVRTRKHGDVLGESQSGLTAGLGLLDLGGDARIIERAREDAAKLAAADPKHARTLTYDITDEEAGFLDRS
ncbi:ATP-dependent DNA helicase RecG [Corynebacterium hansenii]|uniref:ATP-dependent DNA helicase RecG n=1 Tax=Corynebacterium hansenii TaxID=394964 RepID=A0ABV7ZR56_9CORY|nr:ATP-dependent DNA helicase RecG [Corynebacterium hansenii]WJY99690.1 ATP-dependent DNA helicase RecG [Corynebacterium hansenii]